MYVNTSTTCTLLFSSFTSTAGLLFSRIQSSKLINNPKILHFIFTRFGIILVFKNFKNRILDQISLSQLVEVASAFRYHCPVTPIISSASALSILQQHFLVSTATDFSREQFYLRTDGMFIGFSVAFSPTFSFPRSSSSSSFSTTSRAISPNTISSFPNCSNV